MNSAPRLVLITLIALTLGACASPDPSARSLSDVAPSATATSGHPIALSQQRPTATTLAPTAAPPEPTAAPLTPTAAPPPPTAAPLIPTAAPPPPTATQAAPTTTPPAPTADPVAITAARRPDRIIIDSIALDRTLVEVGLDANHTPVVPDYDVAWYQRSALPGTGENVVIWGHALRFSATPEVPAPLERVKEAKIGDTVTIVTADGSSFTYVIRDQIWVLPSQVDYILPRGHELLTIVNCIGEVVVGGDGQLTMTHRLITVAEPAW